jgi:hypothetical protein
MVEYYQDDDGFPLIFGADNSHLNYDCKLAEYRSKLKKGGFSRRHLRDGWLSPRMAKLIKTVAHSKAVYPFRHEDLGSYLPEHIWSHLQCSRSSFLRGVQHVLAKIGDTLEANKIPTIENVKEQVFGCDEIWEYYGPAKVYFDNGGRIEFVIDAVLRLSKTSKERGEFDEILQHENKYKGYANDEQYVDVLPTSPFDQDYDLIRIMCLDRRCFEATGTMTTYKESSPMSLGNDVKFDWDLLEEFGTPPLVKQAK